MAQTTYNASVAYNAAIPYDGLVADVAAETPPVFPTGTRRRPQPVARHGRGRGITYSTGYGVGEAVLSDDEFVIFDLI